MCSAELAMRTEWLDSAGARTAKMIELTPRVPGLTF